MLGFGAGCSIRKAATCSVGYSRMKSLTLMPLASCIMSSDDKMNARDRDHLIRLITIPPPGTKIAAAREFGIDLTLLVRKLGMTPTARLKELAADQGFVEEMRRAAPDGQF